MATRLEKVKKIFHHFDVDGDGRLDHNEIAAFVRAVNPRISFTGEQIKAIIDEVFLPYGDLLGGDDRRLSLDVLLRTYDDGACDVDRDFDALGLSLDDDDNHAAASTAASGVSPTSPVQPPPLPPRPRQPTPWRLAGELEGLIRRLGRRRMKEADKVNAAKHRVDGMQNLTGVVSSFERIGEHRPVGYSSVSPRADGYGNGDGDGDGDGASPHQSAAWDRQSSLASSSFCSETEDSELDYRDRPPQSELEEIPSFRWLSPSLMPKKAPTHRPESSEVDWEHLPFPINGFTDNDWMVGWTCNSPFLTTDPIPTSILVHIRLPIKRAQFLGLDESSGKSCAVMPARGLKITWRDDRSSWRYNEEVAVLSEVCWLDIRAEVDAADLSPGTAYVCLLVFKLSPGAFGLGLGGETQKASVSVGGRCVSDRTVRLQPASGRKSSDGAVEPRRRRDGWMEMELGEFSVDKASRGSEERVVVGMGLREVERLTQPKGGLVVRGVEVRPKQFSHKELTRFSHWRRRG